MSVIHVNYENFDEVVLSSKSPVLVDFSATWCGPCQMIAPIIDEIAEENDDFTVVKIDVDEAPELAMKYQIVRIPTLIVVKDGEAVNKSVGLISKEDILDMLN